MIRYMLDTNACIQIINGNIAMQARLLQLTPAEVCISQIVRYELAFGVCHSAQPAKNQTKLAAFLKYIQVLDFSTEHANEAAQIRCELTKKGIPIGPYDTLIAAHARALDLVMITHNTREFGRVVGLKIEDWQEN